MPKVEIYHGIAPVSEKGFECFGRTDCVTDLNQPRDLPVHSSVHPVQAVAKSRLIYHYREECVEVTEKSTLQKSLIGCPRVKCMQVLPELLPALTHG